MLYETKINSYFRNLQNFNLKALNGYSIKNYELLKSVSLVDVEFVDLDQ